VGSGNAGVGGAALPVRTIWPPGFPLGKHGCCVLLAQQFWLIPPLMSTHCPAGVMLTQAEPVQVVSQVPQPAALSWVWPGHGREPARTEFPVESGGPIVMVPAGVPPGEQSSNSV